MNNEPGTTCQYFLNSSEVLSLTDNECSPTNKISLPCLNSIHNK